MIYDLQVRMCLYLIIVCINIHGFLALVKSSGHIFNLTQIDISPIRVGALPTNLLHVCVQVM